MANDFMRRAATITVSAVISLSIAAATMSAADAEPKDPAGTSEYFSCLSQLLDKINKDHSRISDRDFWDMAEVCCASLDGTWHPRDGSCYLPSGEQTKPSPQGAKRPTGVVALPPGATDTNLIN